MPEIKERPILFAAPMVRAILAGQKTVTRRVVKVQPFDLSWSRRDHSFGYLSGRAENGDELDGFYAYSTRSGGEWSAKCPYGQPGDRLWVRETWLEDPEDDGTWAYTQYMGCKGSPLSDIPTRFQKPDHCIFRASWEGADLLWRPSIHMPRWASRILLEITEVRVERLQAISDEQCVAEGCGVGPGAIGVKLTVPPGASMPQAMFAELWKSINGASAWDSNPWVWVVEFKRVTP